MSIVNVKLRQKEKNKYRKMLSTDEDIYGDFQMFVNSSICYTAGASLEEGEWFFVDNANHQAFTSDILNHKFESVDFDLLVRSEFNKIDYIFVLSSDTIYFQNVSKARLVTRKSIFNMGENYEYRNDCQEIVINDLPDAIYVPSENRLYFRRLESITSIFKGIDQLYREATEEEVDSFLKSDFIALQDNYCISNVKTANRKRIALAKKTLETLSESDRKKIFTYIGEYCPNLKTDKESFKVGTEDELKMLLFGIEQRFYTTPVGEEKRLANSIIPL